MMKCGEESAHCSKDRKTDLSYRRPSPGIPNEQAHAAQQTKRDLSPATQFLMDTKPRHERNAHSRAMRRALMDITPVNSHPQTQSRLFSMLPSEVRNLIFSYVVCQTNNYDKPVSATSHINRPGHKFNTKIDTALLRTCRLIYYETWTIPLRSTTHHLYEAPSESFNPRDWDHYLFHLSSQSGQYLHHLHVTKWTSPFTFSDHLNEHLHWRKTTWTLCASEWTPKAMRDHFDVSKSLLEARFPDTVQEANLEYESLQKFPKQRKLLREVAQNCRKIQLTRRDGTKLEIDLDNSIEYTWEGTTWVPANRGDNHWNGDYETATYHVIRLCWRGKMPERNYMHYDRLDCLRSGAITRMTPEDIEKDQEVS